MYVATIQNLNYRGQESKTFTLQFIFSFVTLKQSQGHQTYNDNMSPKQGCNHAKFKRACFSDVREKANFKVFSN